MSDLPPPNLEIASNKERGNVLFIILLAVALFAALAYAVTQSTRSGGGDASKETTTLEASQIMQYGTEVQTAIMRMRISNNCSDTQISFENPFVSGYTNPNAPGNYSCHVFRPEGGNVVWKNCKESICGSSGSWIYSGGPNVYDISGGTSSPDLVAHLPIHSGDICLAINRGLGLPSTDLTNSTLAIDWFYYNTWKFTGEYTLTNNIIDDGGNFADFWGKSSACLKTHSPFLPQAGGAPYFYYHVLIPR